MQYAAFLSFAGAVAASALMESGENASFLALKAVMERQTVCVPVTAGANLCERSCGPGFITCVSLPNCYNPGRGQSCCSNGRYCDPGYYCTNAGCCPNGTPLERCGATISLSVIPPPATTAAPPASSSPPPVVTSKTTTTSAVVSPPVSNVTPSVYPTSSKGGAVTSSKPPTNATTTKVSPTVIPGAATQNTAAGALSLVAGLAALVAFF